MGEKRAYKSRKSGGGRKKLKPKYDAGKNLKEQMESAVALYEEEYSLRSIADALTLNPIKVRKLLITAGVYESEVAEKVQDTFEEYRKTQSYKEAIPSLHAATLPVPFPWPLPLYRQLCFSLLGCSPCNARRSDPADSPLAGNTPVSFS